MQMKIKWFYRVCYMAIAAVMLRRIILKVCPPKDDGKLNVALLTADECVFKNCNLNDMHGVIIRLSDNGQYRYICVASAGRKESLSGIVKTVSNGIRTLTNRKNISCSVCMVKRGIRITSPNDAIRYLREKYG